MDIQLNFINKSGDVNNSQVVIFQKNLAHNTNQHATAWHVINHLGYDWTHPFTYSTSFDIGVSDAWGNYTPKFLATQGEKWVFEHSDDGDVLSRQGAADTPYEVEILNNLQQGAINACVYNCGKLSAIQSNVIPAQKAAFEFKPTIWVGVATQIKEGEVISSSMLQDISTEISLLGVQSADIVMTGGGMGPTAKALQFSLTNIVRI